jgi:PAS domain S-box-containing protein
MSGALLITGDPAGPSAATIRAATSDTGVALVEVSPDPAAIRRVLHDQIVDCTVAVVSAEIERPDAIARHVHHAGAATRLVVVADQVSHVRHRLAREPLSGTKWTVVPLHGPELPAAIRQAIGATRRTRQLRTTLDRFNGRLSLPRAIDPAEHRRLHLSDRFLRALIAATPDPVFALDLESRVVNWNQAAERTFRRSAHEAVGRRLETIVPPQVRGPLRAAVDRAMAGAPRVVCEIAMPGSDRMIVVLTVPVIDGDRQIAVLCVGRDVTMRRTIERLYARERELNELGRRKDEFLMILSHELRTPLNAILGWVSMIRQNAVDPAKMSHALEVIERNAQAQMRLVGDLVEIARIVTGKLTLQLATIDPATCVSAAVGALEPSADAKGIRLLVAFDPAEGLVVADPGRVQQIVRNLLSNAIKFTPSGGIVQVRLERTPSHVHLVISDTGPGIPSDFLPSVFERFRQGDAVAARGEGEGLGLGLAITRHLVELHKGTMTAENNNSGGATFRVTLPVMPVGSA